jgi:stage III sporulation protein SpoIIIAA
MSAAGAATFNNDVTAFSDERLKEDIQPITGGLEKVMQLQGVTYKRKDVSDPKTQIGVIAQQVEPILPEVVLTAEDEMGTKSVDYAKMTAVLIEAVKELKQEITQLKQQINNGG